MVHRRTLSPFRFALAAAASIGVVLAGQASAEDFEAIRVAAGLDRPIFATAPPGDRDRLFVVEQRARQILILDLATHQILPDPFLVVNRVAIGNERGVRAMAFHPQYRDNGTFFVLVSTIGASELRSYQVSPADANRADGSSETVILRITQPQVQHEASWLAFGPDGMLYVATGDGGGANDDGSGHTPDTGNAQDTSENLLGKILRIDPDGDDFPGDPQRNYAIPADNPFVNAPGDDEIWALGLRDPYRASFDRATGDLYIGDRGESAAEEVNFQPAASLGGENYGWRLREGTLATPTGGVGGPHPPGAIDPIYAYEHGILALQGDAVVGGVVYRGPVRELQGRYIFANYDQGPARIWSLRVDDSVDPSAFDGTNTTSFTDWSGALPFEPDEGFIDQISAFAEDTDANLYILDQSGEIYKIQAICRDGTDADGDGICDEADNCLMAANLYQEDCDGDGFGNACDPDYDADLRVGISDWRRFVLAALLGETLGPALACFDSSGDGALDMSDIGVFIERLGKSPGPSGLVCAGRTPCEAP